MSLTATGSPSRLKPCNNPKWPYYSPRRYRPKRYRELVEGALQIPDSYPSGENLALPHAIPDDQRKQLRIKRRIRCCTVRFCYDFVTSFLGQLIVTLQVYAFSIR